MATVEDGHTLARQGKARKALKVSLFASVIGDPFSDIVLILSAAHLARVALQFGPVEYTAIAVIALTIIASASGSSLLKGRSEEHTSELQSLMRISYAVFCLYTTNTLLNTLPASYSIFI